LASLREGKSEDAAVKYTFLERLFADMNASSSSE
jgi:hypothetical protein